MVPLVFVKTHFLTHFGRAFLRKMAHFQGFLGRKGAEMAQKGLKMGGLHLFVDPKWSLITVGKTRFCPFLTHLWSQNGPF